MKTYISILRGINVSGQKLIKMEALRKMYENMGFQNVITYVQSGNVIFSTNEEEPNIMAKTISDQIQLVFGFDVPLIVLTIDQLERIINDNPFANNTDKLGYHLYVTFLSSAPDYSVKSIIENKKQSDEEIHFSDHAIYLYCPTGYGKTKLNNNFLESKLNVVATTRNWQTTNELLKLAREIG